MFQKCRNNIKKRGKWHIKWSEPNESDNETDVCWYRNGSGVRDLTPYNAFKMSKGLVDKDGGGLIFDGSGAFFDILYIKSSEEV